jgi:hypothetical protein
VPCTKVKLIDQPIQKAVFKIEREDSKDTTGDESNEGSTMLDSFRISPKSRVNFSKLSKAELEERCKRQAYEIKQLKRKVRNYSKKTSVSQMELTVDQIKLIAANDVLNECEGIKPEQRCILVDIASLVLRKDMLMRSPFVASLSAMTRKHMCYRMEPTRYVGELSGDHMEQLKKIKLEMGVPNQLA